MTGARGEAAIALRYALAPACIGAAVLLNMSPLGPLLHPTGPFMLGVIAAAWFGGAGPGILAALLSAISAPQLIAIGNFSTGYPLLAGFFDLPRFITLGLTGAAVGWGTGSYRRTEAMLRERERELTKARDKLERAVAERTAHVTASEERYALAVAGSDDGVWDVDFAARRVFLSARARELSGLPPGPELVPFDEFLAMLPIHPEDVPRRNAAIQAHLAGKTAAYEGEFRLRQRDGVYRWRRVHGICVRDANGQPQRMAGSFSDIDARRRAEDALRLSEERYALALEASAEGYFDTDLETGEMFVSARLNEIYGFPGKAKLTNRVEYLDQIPFHPDDRDVLAEIPAKDVYEFECRIVPRPGAIRWIHTRGKVIRDAEGRARRRVGVVRDITDRKQALETLRESEARFRAIAELSSEGYWEQDENLRFIPYTGTPVDIAGYATDDRVGKTRWELQPEAMPLSGTWQEHQSDLVARRPFRDFQYRRMRPDGEIGYYSASGVPLFDDQGRFKGFFGVARDITERKRFEEELRSRKEMLELAQKSARAVPWEWKNGAPPEVNRWSPELAAVFGVSPDAFDGTVAGWWRFCHPHDVPRVKASIAHTLATGEIDAEYRVTHPDGKVRWLNQKGRTFFDANGNPERSIGFMFDITERRKVEEDLRSRQEMLDLAQKSARVIAFEWNIGVGEGENRWSPDLEAMYGFAPGTYDGSFESWKKVVHPEDWPAVQEAISHAHRTGEVAAEYRVVHPDGSVHWLQARGRMFFDAAGSPSRMVGFMQDVTERQQAEADMRKLEQELRRAQRLEAMGTLAGGIAHDFNNILGAILGYGEMAMRDAKKGTRLRRDLDSILAAGERGRSLVDRILAFSRSGIGERVPVHVEAVAREALDQLAAKLPPNVTIAPRLHAGRAAMLGDSTQVHQVVMNLVTNAVQAMPQGGVLRVSLELTRLASERAASVGTLSPGEYLVLKVKDSGTGIPAEVLERMFDPFFTTKEIGVGSGLGLSLVHGIVTSVGGAVDVATELGKGSTFTVYLRRSGDAPEEQADVNRPLPRGEGQRVLVVDDEEPLARLATETLELLGYAPVAFTSSTAALAAFRADPQRFDAVLTDERMPGLSGSALIREVRGIRGAIPVVLMSGYLGMKSVDADVVVRKPLSASELAASMARALHS